jgi:GT2 family glycosyltransferase/2-polyprenyl-3-methyl-5-hydroxy-6-metoxy-1,4-benzoquinol methylase
VVAAVFNSSESEKYAREVGPDREDSLSKIANLIRPGSTVLDIGAGQGALGKWLRENKNCQIDAIDNDAKVVSQALPWHRKYVISDVENIELTDIFHGERYDYVVCADVLEHLKNPGRTIRQIKRLLHEDGCVLLSIPNVGYAGLLGELLQGQFNYRETGLLDRTHLKFFTRTSLLNFLKENGLHPIGGVDTVRVQLHESEFAPNCLQQLAPKLQRQLLALPDALTYQFIVEATCCDQPEARALDLDTSISNSHADIFFKSELFWRGSDEDYAPARSAMAIGIFGRSRQLLTFSIPPMHDVESFRLDITDRPGFVHLHAIRVVNRNNTILWEWPGTVQSLNDMRKAQVAVSALSTDESGAILAATGDDPQLHLNIPKGRLLSLHTGGRLEAEMSWPMSADFMQISQALDDQNLCLLSRMRRQEDEITEAQTHTANLQHALDAANAHAKDIEADSNTKLNDVKDCLAMSERQVQQLENQLKGTFNRQKKLRAKLVKQRHVYKQKEKEYKNALAAESRRAGELSRALFDIEHSKIWRATRPIRRGGDLFKHFIRGILRRSYDFMIDPSDDVKRASKGWQWFSQHNDPFFTLMPKKGRYPGGWVIIEIGLNVQDKVFQGPRLYMDIGYGFSEEHVLSLPLPTDGKSRTIECLPQRIKALRLDPMESAGHFNLDVVHIKELSRVEATVRGLRPALLHCVKHPASIGRIARRLYGRLKANGIQGLKTALREEVLRRDKDRSYEAWLAAFDTLTDDNRKQIKQRVATFSYSPLISIIVPVYNTPKELLIQCIESALTQLYENIELCLADDASTVPHVRKILKRYESMDARIKVAWRKHNGHISEASNSALELANGEFIALLDHDDILSEDALYQVVKTLNENQALDIIYSDEDKVDEEGWRYSPHFKSDWNPELFYSQNYVSHLGVYRKEIVDKVGGFRKGYEGSQDYDLCIRCVAETNADRIHHIPKVLYHWRAIPGSAAVSVEEKPYAFEAGVNALRDYFHTVDPKIYVEKGSIPTTYRVHYPLPSNLPLVSIVIPTRDNYSVLRNCIESIREKTSYDNYEIVVVDNGSEHSRTLAYLEKLSKQDRCSILRYDYPFNYSAINNYAVSHASGGIVALLNDDVEVITEEWLGEMVSHAARSDIGVVGAKLLYQNGTIQHAGILLGIGGGGGHSHKWCHSPGYFGRASLTQNLSAVTGACMVVRKSVFNEVDGLNEQQLPITYNDVDFCLKVRKLGYRNVWTPYAVLYHRESMSRGLDTTPEKKGRLEREKNYMEGKWGDQFHRDPYYNPNLTLQKEDFSLAWPPRIKDAFTFSIV